MDLTSLLPPGGLGAVSAGGLLATVVIYLLSANRQDRREYLEAVDRAESRADAADQRAEALQQALDEARSARRQAEDRCAAAERDLARYRTAGGPP